MPDMTGADAEDHCQRLRDRADMNELTFELLFELFDCGVLTTIQPGVDDSELSTDPNLTEEMKFRLTFLPR